MARLEFTTGQFQVRGLKEFLSTLERLRLNVGKAGKEALWAVGAHLENKLKRKLSRPGTGKSYRTGKKGKRYKIHKASAPGMPPAVAFGGLRASITHNVTGRPGNRLPDPGGKGDTVKGHVGTNIPYGYYLERGTTRHRRILPRPWFYITVQQQSANTIRIIQNTLRDYIRREAGRR